MLALQFRMTTARQNLIPYPQLRRLALVGWVLARVQALTCLESYASLWLNLMPNLSCVAWGLLFNSS